MSGWLAQFPHETQAVIRRLSVPRRNPIPRKERRAAERNQGKPVHFDFGDSRAACCKARKSLTTNRSFVTCAHCIRMLVERNMLSS